MAHPTRALWLAWLVAASCGRERPANHDSRPGSPPDGWFLSGSSAAQFRAVTDPGVAHGGRASARLEAIRADVDGTGTIMQSIAPDAYRGKRVRLSGFVKADGVTGWAGLWMRVDRAQGRSAFDNMQDRAIHGTSGWTRHEVVLDVAADATSLHFGLLQAGAGSCHLDDVTLEVVGADVKVTELDSRPRTLQNADFESGTGRPDGWLLAGFGKDDVVVTLDREGPKHGAASAKIESRVEYPRGVSMLVQAIRAEDYRGKRVRASAWLKGSGVGQARWFAKVDATGAGADSNGVAGASCTLPSGTFGWQRCDAVFDVPLADSDAIEVGAELEGRSTLWIDGAELVEVGGDVPLTEGELGPRALVNGDFESGDPELSPWFMSGGARSHYQAALDPAVKYRGEVSARLKPLVAKPLGYGVLIQSIQAVDYRGQRVRMTAAIKLVDASGDLWLRVQSASSPGDGPGLGWDSHLLTGTSDWRSYELVVEVPERADMIEIGAGLRGRGTIWLDDVRLEAVARDAAVAPGTAVPRALANGGFEAGASDEVEGWFLSGGASAEFEASIDRSEYAAGAVSARLRPRVASPSGYGTLMQAFLASDFRGKRLRMTSLVKGEGITGRGDLWLRVQAAYSPGDGPGLGGGSCQLSRSFAWKPCTITFDVPDEGESIELGIGLAGPGTLWLDQVVLEEVSREVPVTGVVRARTRPINLDFEAGAPAQ